MQNLDACSDYRVWTDMHVRATRSLNWLAINCVCLIALQFSRLISYLWIIDNIKWWTMNILPWDLPQTYCTCICNISLIQRIHAVSTSLIAASVQHLNYVLSNCNYSLKRPYIGGVNENRTRVACVTGMWTSHCSITPMNSMFEWSTRQDSNLRCKSFGVNEVRSPLLVTRRKKHDTYHVYPNGWI